jgi:hypothetical protein
MKKKTTTNYHFEMLNSINILWKSKVEDFRRDYEQMKLEISI